MLVMCCFIPVFALAQSIHWLGFLLDELLYPGYRRTSVKEPVFVLGVPRSGTTHLHRVLAEDERFTTFSTWECLFALSVSARRFWMMVARLDIRIGSPLTTALHWAESRLFAGLADVHSMRLSDPEEDYFALMPVLACFILTLPFPQSHRLWRVGRFDRDMPEKDRARLMDYYQRCLQKHLYAHGRQKRLLSKNAAFAPFAGSLLDRFPDARFVLCLREPSKTLPSQLSSIESGLAAFDSLSQVPDLRERLVRQLGFYYRNLDRACSPLPESRRVWVTMGALKADLGQAVERIYDRLEIPLSETFRDRLAHQDATAKQYRSGHAYDLARYGLAPEDIQRELGELYDRLAAQALDAEDAMQSHASSGTRHVSIPETPQPC